MKDWVLKFDGSWTAILIHSLLWIGFYLGFTIIMAFYGGWQRFFIVNSVTTFLFMVAYYTLRYLQIPHLYKKGKFFFFILSFFIGTLLCYCISWGLRIAILEKLLTFYPERPFEYLGEYLIRTLRFYSPAFLLLVWEYQHNRKRDQIRVIEVEKEKIAAELKFLKAQINPHFLFNTLNNLYSFVVTESPMASDMLDRLTGIFHYAFDRSQQTEVLLQYEVDTIADYIALEKIRYGNRLEVVYNTSGDLTQPISPLILLSIIENAFKHGASGDINEPKINIDISSKNNITHCKVWNTKSQYIGELNDAYKSGIGLSNLRRQLDLIYPGKHNLNIEESRDSFTLTLSINTA